MIGFKRPKAALRMRPNLDVARWPCHRSFLMCYRLLGVEAMVSVRGTKEGWSSNQPHEADSLTLAADAESFGGKKLISNGGGDEGHGDLEISGQDNGR